ncbi:MAG: DUF58 domain-containing protein [Gammaproteobacteria bacterium]|nr:DUF58 domain-containing protein [Gammaproteobacteria bacterium]
MIKPQPGVQVALADLLALRANVRQLKLASRGRVLATRTGGHLSRFRGRGMEFDESRVYQAGDDPRNMDWRVTARAGVPHIKLFREERERPIWVFVDQGANMRFGTRRAFKSVVAAQAAALIAWRAIDDADRVGCFVFNEHHAFYQRPAARSRGLMPLLNALTSLNERATSAGYASPDAAARELVKLVRPGSLVFLFSDFTDCAVDTSSWLGPMVWHSEVVMVDVVDPIEINPPPAGQYPVTDGTRTLVLDFAQRGLREAYLKRYQQHCERMADFSRRFGVHRLTLRTDDNIVSALATRLHSRATSSRTR